MKEQIVTSKKFSLNWLDAAKGLLMSVITGVLVSIESALQTGELNWKKIAIAAAAAGVAYLLKNFFTPATVKTPAE